jgi:hypothetical protein
LSLIKETQLKVNIQLKKAFNMSGEVKPNNRNLDINYLVMCYLKNLLPTWKGDISDMSRIIKLLEGYIITRVQTECITIKQQCVQDPTIVSHTLILQKAVALKKDQAVILKQLQPQI